MSEPTARAELLPPPKVTQNLPAEMAGARAAGNGVASLRHENPEPRPSALAAALSLARDSCAEVPKSGWNDFHKYKYTTSQDVLRVGREALKSSGLALILSAPQLDVIGSGGATIYALKRRVALVHASGENIDLGELRWPVIPDKGRPLDKAMASACTSSLSEMYRDLLQIPAYNPAKDQAAREDKDDGHAPGTVSARELAEKAKAAAAPAPAQPAETAPAREARPATIATQPAAVAEAPITEAQVKSMLALRSLLNLEGAAWLAKLSSFGVKTGLALTQAQATELTQRLEKEAAGKMDRERKEVDKAAASAAAKS